MEKGGFYDVQIEDGEGSISSEEFVNREWDEKGTGYQCIVVNGDLGTGKSILSCRVAKRLLVRKRGDRTIIFISARNQSKEMMEESRKFLNYFCKKVWRKRGKFIVIIDGWDELLESEVIKKSERIFEAAKHYKATLLISCRTAAMDKIYEIENAVDQSLKMKKLSKNTEKRSRKEERLFENISKEVLSEAKAVPLFKKYIETIVDREGNEESDFLKNDYVFVRELYRIICNREEEKYDSYRTNKESMECNFKIIAKNICKYGERPFTLDSCIQNEKDTYRELMEISFYKEMISMEKSKDVLIVKGFKYRMFWRFFLAEELYDRLQGDENELISFLQLNWKSNEFANMKEGMLKSVPADKSINIRKKLKDTLNNNEDVRIEIENILEVL